MEATLNPAAALYEPLFVTSSKEHLVLEFGVTPDGTYIIAGDGKILAQYRSDTEQLPLAMRTFDRLRHTVKA